MPKNDVVTLSIFTREAGQSWNIGISPRRLKHFSFFLLPVCTIGNVASANKDNGRDGNGLVHGHRSKQRMKFIHYFVGRNYRNVTLLRNNQLVLKGIVLS